VTRPANHSFTRYLAAKKALDDRSLNCGVRQALARALKARPHSDPLRVLEAGCGIGTMVERLLDWDLLHRAVYTGLDAEPHLIAAARERLGGSGGAESAAPLLVRRGDRQVRVELEAVDLFDFIDREKGRATWDLLIAHAFLDLVDLADVLPRMFSLLRPGGLFYFTLNFDGATILEPVLDPDLDRQIEVLYHGTMDRRRVQRRPAGDSRTGRRLFRALAAAGARVAAAGSSDWVVFPGPNGGYPGDEAYFLHFIIDTMRLALEEHPGLDPARFSHWIETRHLQIEAGQLIYLAHQLDFFGFI
jgi:SAM-dependent methyltransferase